LSTAEKNPDMNQNQIGYIKPISSVALMESKSVDETSTSMLTENLFNEHRDDISKATMI